MVTNCIAGFVQCIVSAPFLTVMFNPALTLFVIRNDNVLVTVIGKLELQKMRKIGILAYGSLIDNPGTEIEPLIIDKIKCTTPFKVEYARKSRTRGEAPTLIPREDIGQKVYAVILVLKDEVDLELAKSMLWRRETGQLDSEKKYTESSISNENKVEVKTLKDFFDVETILYTSIGKNIEGEINADILSSLAIKSILSDAGENKRDGVRYLLNNLENGIITQFSEQYKEEILKKTKTNSLQEAITKLDRQRNGN